MISKEIERITALLSPQDKEKCKPVCDLLSQLCNKIQPEEKPHMEIPYELRVKQIIFSPPATTVLWEDGTKTTVKCYQDEFCEDIGFAMACARKLYGTRGRFMTQVNKAYRQPKKEEKAKKANSVVERGNAKDAEHIEFSVLPVGAATNAVVFGKDIHSPDELMKHIAGDNSMGIVTGIRFRNAE